MPQTPNSFYPLTLRIGGCGIPSGMISFLGGFGIIPHPKKWQLIKNQHIRMRSPSVAMAHQWQQLISGKAHQWHERNELP